MSYFKRIIEDNNKIVIGKVDFKNIDKNQFFKDVGISEKVSEEMINNFKQNNYSLDVIASNLLINDNFLKQIKDSNLNKSFLFELKKKYIYKYHDVIDEDIEKLDLENKIMDFIRKLKEKYIPPSSKPSGDECKKDILKISNFLSVCKFLSGIDRFNNCVNLISELDGIKRIIFQKENEVIRLNCSNGSSMIY